VALSVVLNVEEGSERSWAAGDGLNEGLGEVPRRVDPRYRDLATESVYEYGSRVGIFRLLRLFARRDMRVTAFAAARALEINTDAASCLAEQGHEICAHGYRWAEAWLMGREQEALAIEMAVASLRASTGARPVGWYSRWMPSLNTRELLVEAGGFLYDSDAYNDDCPYYVWVSDQWHLVLPYSLTYNDSLYSYGYLTSPSDFVDYCRRGMKFLLEEDDEVPRLMSIGLHPRLSGQAARASAVAEVLDYALGRDDVWIAARADIARYWLGAHPPPVEAPDG
jgi:peptidoglycan/xylan/chitin deacetylase (PgdA/CDA1 family)